MAFMRFLIWAKKYSSSSLSGLSISSVSPSSTRAPIRMYMRRVAAVVEDHVGAALGKSKMRSA